MVFLKTFVSLMVKNATFCKKYLVNNYILYNFAAVTIQLLNIVL